MFEFFIAVGIACVIAAIAGGSVKVANVFSLDKELSARRQAALGTLGAGLIVLAFVLNNGGGDSRPSPNPKETQYVTSLVKQAEREQEKIKHEQEFEEMPAKLKLSPNSGGVGTQLTVTGTGFKPGESVRIIFQATPIAEANADRSGTFSKVITVPKLGPISEAGIMEVTATGGSSNKSAEHSFEVT
jgi:hypothetical protein